MTALPTGIALLVRTDFSDDAAWAQVRDEATREYGPEGFSAAVEPVSDPRWSGVAWEAVRAAVPVTDEGPVVLFVADNVTFASAAHPVLAVDLMGRIESAEGLAPDLVPPPFRCIPAALYEVENNLSIANLDWEDFAGSADGDAYRGLELPPLSAAAKEAAERRAEEQRQQEWQQFHELRFWGDRQPSERVRALSGQGPVMARLDLELTEAILNQSPATQRSIARWAARRAYEIAGIAGLGWVAPALRALDEGRELPPPFGDRKQMWEKFFSDPRVPRTTVAALDAVRNDPMRAAMALPALPAATDADPVKAALGALYDAALAAGRDGCPGLLREVRDTFGL